MMELFSQRQGFKPLKSIIQVDGMDGELRNSLWNVLDIYYWREVKEQVLISDRRIHLLFTKLWAYYFKKPIDTIEYSWRDAREEIRTYLFNCPWFEVYDFVEFIANNYYGYDGDSKNEKFMTACNSVLESELSGYRFIGGKISPITSEEEIAEIEEALKTTKSLKLAAIHLKSALDKFSDRQSPDYRNSIKESISAVEAICVLITDKDKATLGEALKRITDKIELHPALRQAFSSLYGYTSNADGIRHALLDEHDLDSEDAKFMLVSCSAFINYLKVKASKAGIDLGTK